MKEMTTKEVQQISLEILKDVHDFCVKNAIRYSLSGGTLLGAIRHNGFIPWDDDIDIQMPRPDYDRFINSYTSKKGYKVISRELPIYKEKVYYSYARVCEMQNTFVDTGIMPWITDKTGLWIDILPCDGITSDYRVAKKHLKKIKKITTHAFWSGIKQSSWDNIYKSRNFIYKIKFVIKKILSFFYSEDVFSKLYSLRKQYDYQSSDYFFVTPHYGMGEWQPKTNMENFILHKFEDAEFYIMSGWNANLKSLYGDYMQLPPEDKRITHDFNRYYWKD